MALAGTALVASVPASASLVYLSGADAKGNLISGSFDIDPASTVWDFTAPMTVTIGGVTSTFNATFHFDEKFANLSAYGYGPKLYVLAEASISAPTFQFDLWVPRNYIQYGYNLGGVIHDLNHSVHPALLRSASVLPAPGVAPAVYVNIGMAPEAGTWAMMIGGFGVAGTALRRRRAGAAFA